MLWEPRRSFRTPRYCTTNSSDAEGTTPHRALAPGAGLFPSRGPALPVGDRPTHVLTSHLCPEGAVPLRPSQNPMIVKLFPGRPVTPGVVPPEQHPPGWGSRGGRRAALLFPRFIQRPARRGKRAETGWLLSPSGAHFSFAISLRQAYPCLQRGYAGAVGHISYEGLVSSPLQPQFSGRDIRV